MRKLRYKVVKEYSDNPENPIKVQKGEILEFVEESDFAGNWPNWVYCKGEDKEGWIPKQILKISSNRVTCLEDYIAREHSLKVDEILVAKYELNGWIWSCKEKENDLYAWAPLSYLIRI